MVEVILDQRFLRLANGLFNRVELLRQIKAGAACLDHFDHAAKMTFGALQPLGYLGMSAVEVLSGHIKPYPPGEDNVKAPPALMQEGNAIDLDGPMRP